MNKDKNHNSNKNLIKHIFEALKFKLWIFVVSIKKIFTYKIVLGLLVLVSFVSVNVLPVRSEKVIDTSFGTTESTNIFPAQIETDSWKGLNNASINDLSDDALYQDFDDSNSAYISSPDIDSDSRGGDESVSGSDSGTGNVDADVDTTGNSNEEQSVEDSTDTETNPEIIEEEVDEPANDEAEAGNQEAESVPVVYWAMPVDVAYNLIDVFPRVDKQYPLAQLSLISTSELLTEDQASPTETEATQSTEEDVPVVVSETEDIETVDVSETSDVTEDGSLDATEEEVEMERPAVPMHDVTFSDFSTASLEPGESLDSMQLRISLAASPEIRQTDFTPFIEILYGDADSLDSIGLITLDAEVSNAINGGYFLFALPTLSSIDKLSESMVTVRYHGDKDAVENIFIDAVWLEMTTKTITKEDLLLHQKVDIALDQLEAPKFNILLSDQLNFARTEYPIFNLRYESQQNSLLRGLMRLLGRDSVEVESVVLNHKSIGVISVDPEITMTEDELITLEFKEGDVENMQPGVYEIILTFEENGFEYMDTFDFQWGILSINPSQTEYKIGDTAEFSIGALTQNGNTLCDAKLDLYVTDPAGSVTKLPVISSGDCIGNNVIDSPDYTAGGLMLNVEGEYEVYLESLDQDNNIIGFTTDSIKVVSEQLISIKREGPTRIYPPASYPMSLTVSSATNFTGQLKERVPANFVVSSTSAEVTQDGEWQVLTWNLSIEAGNSETVSYGFDAPDISPYLYNIGPASIESEISIIEKNETSAPIEEVIELENLLPTEDSEVATSSLEEILPPAGEAESTPVTETSVKTESGVVFAEHRQWQIASDATGSMLLMWDGSAIPTGWTCVSCNPGDVFYQKFILGSSTAGTTGGSATHNHTATAVVSTTGSAGVSNAAGGGTDAATLLHTHTVTPTIGSANNLPSYRNLVIIQNNSAGEPTSIPTGAITLFDATVPTGWTQYSAQNGYYVRGESIANRGTTGGSNTHTHTITGTLSGPTGTTNASNGPTAVGRQDHTHTISSSTASESVEPPYIEAILGKLNATTTLPNDVITMWTDTEPTDWNSVSTSSTPFSSKFFKPAATYGSTGGASTHTPANVNGIISTAANVTNNRQTAGTSDAPGAHTHSVNVTTFTSGSLLPEYRSVNLAKRAGGQPPDAPTIHEMFDHEKTGTSTPEFEFTASDPVGTDSLVYQFQWDDDSDLNTSPLGDRTSDVETGCSPNCFTNTVSGGDSSPFNEGERINFNIQSALTDGTTYYWRVRAKKSTGTTYSAWSEIYSFAYVAETDPSQWMQTQDSQFDKNVFGNTETFGSDSVQIVQATPDDALVVYGEGVVQTPRYQIWDGTTWGGENSAQSVGGTIQWIKTAAGTTRDEYILGTQDASNDVNVQIYDAVGGTWGDLLEVTTGVSDNTRRGFDVAYESLSGDAMIAYCDGDDDPSYYIWNGTNWTGPNTITTVSANNCNYISLAPDPTSDDIIVVTRDTAAGNPDYEAQVWDGSAWANSRTIGNMTDTNHEGIAVEYEESGGQGMVVVSNGNTGGFTWTSWTGTEWTTPTPVSFEDDFEWGDLKRDSGTDKMSLCYIDQDAAIGIVRWDGDAWLTYQEFETAGNDFDGRAVSCEFETTSGRDGYLMIPYSDNVAARYRVWDGSSFGAGEATLSTIDRSWEVGSVRTGDGKILSYFHDSANTQYDFSYWNGTIWSAIQTLEGSPSVTVDPRFQPIDMTAKVYVPSSGTVTSDPISFSLVPNRLTWGEVLWSTTEPSGTDVTIQVLYATSSNTYCNVIVPNGDLTGNGAGFDSSSGPLDLSGLSTTTYSSLCLRATLTSSNSSNPTLDDWTLSWERQSYLVQSQFGWYANRNNENPNDAWPSGGDDLVQNQAIPESYAPGSGDVLRLRMAVRSDNASLSASSKAFKLQYAEESGVCASSTAWHDVGEVGSTTAPWRGYNNLLAFDGSTLSTLLLGSDVGGTYEEENDSDLNPNTISVGDEAEWDWVLEHNGANDGVQYCFRMVNDEGAEFSEYDEYPSLVTNASPGVPLLDKLFDNEQVSSTTPWFDFSAEDPEGEDITYQIQVDINNDFSSPALDRNSSDNSSEFENIVVPADKDPFTMAQTVRFRPASALSNGVTYYWRTRGKDVNGSNDWGEWSTIYSFTVNTGTLVTTWYQTEQEQFDTDEFEDTETSASDDVILTTGFTSGTTTGTTIDFDSKTTGNAWGELSWTEDLTDGTTLYRVEYFDEGTWTLVPDSFLPGNAAGFNSSPVSLLSLDPEVHNEIRLRVNLSDSGGTPRVQSWKVEWGFAVEQPDQIALFDNEKTGTTTPTFTFSTSDPDNDDIQYQFSWSTDNTFASGSTTVVSGTDPGFTNVTTGANTSPFFSGDTISYKIQAGSALTNGQTYWWRVRAKDPGGGDAWSVWSSTRSLTVDTSVTVSTWFQTTDEQFETDSLNDVESTGSDGVEITSIIREAMVAYAEGTVQTPRYKIWNGSTWDTEGSGVSVGGAIRFVETESAHSRDEYMVVTQETSGRVRAQVYDGTVDTFGDLNTIVAAVPSATRRGFDIAYESTSGDALVVACNGTEATYSVWDGSSWNGPNAITLAVAGNCNFIELASDPVSDEIILVARDTIAGATDYNALVWNGGGWANSMTMGSASEAGDQAMTVEYEESGNKAVVVVGNGGAASFTWNSWNGTGWDGVATQGLQNDFENGRLSRDDGTDNMVLCSIDNDNQIAIVRWTGSTNSWIPYQTLTTIGNAKTGRPSDCVFETTAGRDGYIMIPYSDTGAARSQYWDTSNLVGGAAISTIQDSQEVRATRTGDGNILAVFYDDINTQYDFSYWNGTIWSTIETLEGTAITTTAPPTVPISISARRYPAFTSGSVVSPAVDFDDGLGLKWQSVSFSDTTPGASDILYQIEYWDGDSYELIPDGALSGNSSGFSTSPIDISLVSRITYNTIRLVANLNCSGGNCPTLNDWSILWSPGINLSGTAFQYNQTSSSTSGTVAVAVNGSLQSGKTGTISSGSWSIANVTANPGDIVTLFVTGAGSTTEAVAIGRYDGDGDMTGFSLYEKHLTLGTNDEATTTEINNSDIGLYDFTNTEDLFFNVTGSTLVMCADSGCDDARLYIKSGIRYTPGGSLVTHDLQNNGYFTAGSFTHEINGSWDNNATTTMTGSTVIFSATNTTESIDSTGALVSNFNNVTFGTTTGSGTWTLGSALDVDGTLTVSRGTLSRGTTPITVAGTLTNGANGVWSGTGTTTLDGSSAANWNDQNASLQNVGNVVVDGSSKLVTLTGNVAAESITIGANDTLDVSSGSYDITVYGHWLNYNNFVSRSGEVIFMATSTGQTITTTGDAFYDLTFSGTGGGWSFTETTALISNDFRVASGTVTLPTATTTVAGSFITTGGTFAHNNGIIAFTSGSAETVTFNGGLFTNVAHNLYFSGTGSWSLSDTNATSTNDVEVKQGTLNLPSGSFAIGGTLRDTGGSYNPGTGLVLFYSSGAESLTTGGSSYYDVEFDGSGSWSFSDTNVTANRNVIISQGSLSLPSGTLSIAGSYDNNATVNPGTGTVLFNSNDVGETIDFGSSSLYNVTFNHASGGWNISENATTTNNFTLTSATNFTLASSKILAVGGTFTNSVGGASTTWTGSTLSLTAGNYSLNTKTNTGDIYETINVAGNTDIKMWNSSSTAYVVNSTGSLYSQDHNNIDGDLYIFGAYERSGGNEYWSYATDFDGTALGGSSRQVDVKFASGASASFTGSTVNITGTSTASTTIANQGSGTYTVNLNNGTLSAQYYDFSNLGSSGLSLLGTVSVPALANGSFAVGANTASAITLSSTTIDASPGKQIYNVNFTNPLIVATNVSQTDGTPSSFWWFREGTGNIYGENFDNDTGNPGSVRFDDSSLVIAVSGTVYSDAGATPIVGGTCDGSTAVVKVVVEGGSSYTGSCSNIDGSFNIPGVTFTGDPTLTIYLDNASGGEKGSVITRTPTSDITDLDIYANRVIVRNEDVDAATIANFAVYDYDNDIDLRFTASTTGEDTLTLMAGNELFVFATSTFTPGGVVTLNGNSAANGYDGTLYLNNGATFNAYATTTVTIGGRLVLDSSATFSAGSSTVLMNATTTGKSITSSSSLTFNDLTFNGSGGGWNLGADITANGNINITAGTVTGTEDISLPYGSISGNGILSLGAGTTTISRTNTLGGTSAWTFYNLQLGNAVVVGTTTPAFISTTTVSGKLTIASAHYLDAGSTNWDLAGTGTVFVESGTFLEDTSTVRYSGNGSNILSTRYYNLDVNAGAGTPTYTPTGLGIVVDGNLTVGGDANTTLDFNASDPALDINGNLTIRANGTFGASNSGSFTIAGNYENDGVFTANSGTLVFDGAGSTNIAAGASSFSTVFINGTGNVVVSENATATVAWQILAADNFTLSSGQIMAVGGTFYNAVGGTDTTWTGSTLSLYGNGNYSINAATTSDTYGNLDIDGTTQIRMWNGDALTYTVDSTASLYSQDHSSVDGDLYIWGAYRKTTGTDYWSYATDFDGTALGGSSRKVDVYLYSGASVSVIGGSLDVLGTTTASTTIQNQGSGSYGFLIGNNASSSFRYYEERDVDSNGFVFTGNAKINNLSNGDFEVSQNGGTAITLGGTVLNANPAKNFNQNRFALDGVVGGFNVTATGTSVSSWRFVNHYGDIDGEGFDVDPNGNPGYIAWDDSAGFITISGNVYSDEGSTVSTVCDGSTQVITLRIAGAVSSSTSCASGTGAYSIPNVAYGPADSLVVFVDGASVKGAVVTKEPISNITNLDMYENRVIVRHENAGAMTIADMAVWDSTDDADIPFTAVDAGSDTLTLPANYKLLVWEDKEFEPNGNVTVSGGGAGASYDGTLELQTNSIWTGQGTESLSVGGSMILGSGASYVASNGTTTFTTTGSARTIDVNEDVFNHVAFTGSGSWSMTDSIATFNGDFTMTNGDLILPTGTTTFAKSLLNSGGTIDANNGLALFTGVSTKYITLNSSDLSEVRFTGGNYTFNDTNATSTGSITIVSGTITLPSGNMAVGGDFINVGGSITHNTSEVIMTNPTTASVRLANSDLYGIRFSGGGDYTFEDGSVSLLDSLFITNGAVTMATGTTAIGGSFDASGGTFSHSTGTILFNSADTGEFIDAGASNFYTLQISAPTGGYTVVDNATTSNNFSLSSASSFTLQSGATLNIEGVFLNSVGGSSTTWTGSTLVLAGENEYTVNTKTTGGDQYQSLIINQNTDIRLWNSAATTTTVNLSSSVYSQDHAGTNGSLYIYGDFHISTTTEYWSYATDFDGTNLSGSERIVTVAHATSATTTVDGGSLQLVGSSGNETTITNQGSGTYAVGVSGGTFNAQYYRFRNLNSDGVELTGTPTITSLSYGDYELAVNGGTLLSLSSSTLNANASLLVTNNRFATTTAITGYNVTLNGTTSNAWRYTNHTGNLAGEDYDVDGATGCGSIRWADSSCLITQQTDYRWRNDDGGLGVPDSEWYDGDWSARKRVSVLNLDPGDYIDAAVKLLVTYDSDMQADFEDLRFADADGTTVIPHWFGSSTDSVSAEVWVKVADLPGDETATVYMYYGNPSATTSASSTLVFSASDDFEDDNLSEYSGQLSLFDTGTTYAFDGDYGLDNSPNDEGRGNSGGIYRVDQTINQGETVRYLQYVNTAGSTDEVCTKFAIQDISTPNSNYAVCVEMLGTDRISLVKDVRENESQAGASILASSTVDFTSFGSDWYEFEIDWETDDTISVFLYDSAGSLITSISDNDSSYSDGGFGFTYWYNKGGWDSFSSRPLLVTEPTITFGAEQSDGGAGWAANINTLATFDTGDIARLRIAVANSGLGITDQEFLLEYAALGASPSCEAVSPASFASVPVQASCGTSPVCMATSSNVTNGASTFDLLTGVAGAFTAGEVIEDPSNITGNLDVDQDEFIELEYVLTTTENLDDEGLCFRVTDNGTEYDTYLNVAHMSVRFDPVVTDVVLNEGDDISLLPGTTTRVYATSTVTDGNGSSDLSIATTTFYRSGVAGGASCTEDNNNCYVSSGAQCDFVDCSGDSCTVECYADIYFHADPTDTGSAYDGEVWYAFVEVEDVSGGYDFGTSIAEEMGTLRAIDVAGLINYGTIEVLSDTGSTNASTSVLNEGNVEVDVEIQGSDLSDGGSSVIPSTQQKFATSSFTYSACGVECDLLSSTTPTQLNVDLSKPTTDTPPVEDEVYWGIAIPFGINSSVHEGINVFTPVSP